MLLKPKKVHQLFQKGNKTNCQYLQKLFVSIIESTVEQFFTGFAKFRELKDTAKFIKFPDSSSKLNELNSQKFSWTDMNDFEMQSIEFQNGSLWM